MVEKVGALKTTYKAISLTGIFDESTRRTPEKTMEIAEVYLVEDLFLHAKVYYFKGRNPYVCHGSSNLTREGMKVTLNSIAYKL